MPICGKSGSWVEQPMSKRHCILPKMSLQKWLTHCLASNMTLTWNNSCQQQPCWCIVGLTWFPRHNVSYGDLVQQLFTKQSSGVTDKLHQVNGFCKTSLNRCANGGVNEKWTRTVFIPSKNPNAATYPSTPSGFVLLHLHSHCLLSHNPPNCCCHLHLSSWVSAPPNPSAWPGSTEVSGLDIRLQFTAFHFQQKSVHRISQASAKNSHAKQCSIETAVTTIKQAFKVSLTCYSSKITPIHHFCHH